MMLRLTSDRDEVFSASRGHHGRSRRSTRHRRWVAVAVVVMLVLVPVEVSLGRALGASGDAPVSVRLVGWVRDHGGGDVVDRIENWWYSHHPPPAAVDPATVPALPSARGHADPSGPKPGNLPRFVAGTLPGESEWVPSVRRVKGSAPLYTAFFRPLSEAPSVLVGIAWMNQSLLRTQLVAGTLDPRPGNGRSAPVDGGSGQIPDAARSTLVASFNSGFKLKDARGGYLIRGSHAEPLRNGAAALAIDTSGRVDVGQWGRDLALTSTTVAVRQNLDLVVDHGAPVSGLGTNASGAWGSVNNQFQFTWRSGLGIDAAGNLVYVAADRIRLSDLARAMAAAGVVRGMELDMHPQLVTFMSYQPGQAAGGAGTKLLPAMQPATTRYLRPSERDFLAVSALP